MIYKIILV